jgi:hypothetical protein
MIPLKVHLNAPEIFDAIIQGTAPHITMPEGGDLTLITKDGGAISGRAMRCSRMRHGNNLQRK